MFQETLLKDEDCEQIRDAVYRVLENVGMMFQNETLLRNLERAGARVEWSEERAHIPRSMIQEIVDDLKSTVGDREVRPSLSPPGLPGLGVQVAQFFFDWEKKERRSGNRSDFIRMIQFGDALDPQATIGHSLLMTDVPPKIEPLEAVALLIEYAHHPGYTYPHHAEQFDYLAEMGEIWAGDRQHFLIGGIFLTSPLRICRRAADFLVKRLELGLACACGTMPCVGASVPVTLAGAVTVTAAEILGSWAAIRATSSEAPLRASVAAGSIDMRSGNATYCSPEAMLLNFGTAEFFRRLCGVRIGIAGASDYADARFPGREAAFEKAFKAMMVAAFTGTIPTAGQGMLESGKTLSPEQLLIDREMTEYLRHFAKPIDVDAETLPLDTIEQIGVGIKKSYLDCDHTLANFRSCLWHPSLWMRTVWQSFDAEAAEPTRIVDRAHQVFVEKLNEYEKPHRDPEKLAAIHAVLEKAKRNL